MRDAMLSLTFEEMRAMIVHVYRECEREEQSDDQVAQFKARMCAMGLAALQIAICTKMDEE
jgi:hypothetical protein